MTEEQFFKSLSAHYERFADYDEDADYTVININKLNYDEE